MPSIVQQGVWVPVKYSEWATGIVPVTKKNGSTRLCADYKSTLNPVIHKDTYKSPSVDEVLVAATECCVFGELDAKDAYLQVPVSYFGNLHDDDCQHTQRVIPTYYIAIWHTVGSWDIPANNGRITGKYQRS